MITLRGTNERQHDLRKKREEWLTFPPAEPATLFAGGFGALESLSEAHLQPGGSIPRKPRHDSEILTYVREGTLSYEDSLGRSGAIQAGEFQLATSGRRVRYRETNASRVDGAHVFQLWLRPAVTDLEQEREQEREQRRFSVAERQNRLCVVASDDARRASLRLQEDVVVYSALLARGQHVVHELSFGRSAWLHVVSGELSLGDSLLTTGDGAAFTAERVLSLTARERSEILLLDLGEPRSGRPHRIAAISPRRTEARPRARVVRHGAYQAAAPRW
jgi:redox-sensitive bicupin YhaK (pirin superfamily)